MYNTYKLIKYIEESIDLSHWADEIHGYERLSGLHEVSGWACPTCSSIMATPSMELSRMPWNSVSSAWCSRCCLRSTPPRITSCNVPGPRNSFKRDENRWNSIENQWFSMVLIGFLMVLRSFKALRSCLGLDGKRRNLIHVLAGFTKSLAPEATEIAEELLKHLGRFRRWF